LALRKQGSDAVSQWSSINNQASRIQDQKSTISKRQDLWCLVVGQESLGHEPVAQISPDAVVTLTITDSLATAACCDRKADRQVAR
jgi:hypothetical protein